MQMIIPGTEQAIMLQNMYLALQAMGLGGWIFTSSVSAFIFPMMGFRFHIPSKFGPIKTLNQEAGPRPVPVGLDDHFQAFFPPYYPDMDAAVHAIFDAKWGGGGGYKGGGGPVGVNDREELGKNVPKKPRRWPGG